MSDLRCNQCGMTVESGEYHPYAACLMYKECYDNETVRVNLAAVMEHGSKQLQFKLTAKEESIANLNDQIERLRELNGDAEQLSRLFLEGLSGEKLVIGSDLQTDEDSGYSNFIAFNKNTKYKQKIIFRIEEI